MSEQAMPSAKRAAPLLYAQDIEKTYRQGGESLSVLKNLNLAVESGEIHSLADILNTLHGKLPGEIAGVEVERKDGRWRYEFRVVDSQGRLFEVYVDPRSGEIERIKEK